MAQCYDLVTPCYEPVTPCYDPVTPCFTAAGGVGAVPASDAAGGSGAARLVLLQHPHLRLCPGRLHQDGLQTLHRREFASVGGVELLGAETEIGI